MSLPSEAASATGDADFHPASSSSSASVSASAPEFSSSAVASAAANDQEHPDDLGPVDGILGSGKVQVSVSDPTKVGEGMGAYTVFRVTTKVVSSAARIFTVNRRYSDFEWLHHQLTCSYPGIIIPPLPDKSFIGRFSSEFVESRQRGLEKFLARVLNHKLLCKSQDLPAFVLADEQNLERAKLAGKEIETQKSKGFMDYFTDFSSTISSSFAGQKPRPRSVDDVMCDDVSAYANSLGSALQSADANTDKLLSQSRIVANAWFEFGLSFTMLGSFESEQKDAALGNALQKLGHCADRLSVLCNQKAGKEATCFLEPIQDYIRLVEAIKNMMKSRSDVADRVHKAQQVLDSKLAFASWSKENSTGSAKISAADVEVKEAEDKLALETKELQKVTRRVTVEINNFRKLKGAEFKQFILDFVHLQIDYAAKVQAAWEGILPEIESM